MLEFKKTCPFEVKGGVIRDSGKISTGK